MKITPENHMEVGECSILIESQTSSQQSIEYRVRPVTRYVVTRYSESELSRQIGGDQSDYFTAFLIAEALAMEAGRKELIHSTRSGLTEGRLEGYSFPHQDSCQTR